MAVIGLLTLLLVSWAAPAQPAQRTAVFVTASFQDKNRLYLENLSREEIHVFENGKPREVEFFASKEVPVAYGLLWDRDLLPKPFDDLRAGQYGIPSATAATNVAYQLLDQALGHYVGWVAAYDSEFRLAIDFTQDTGLIKDAMQQLQGERLTEEPTLYGALFTAVKKLSQRNEKRRVLIVFLDYLDFETSGKLKPLKNLLSASNVELIIAGFPVSKVTSSHGLPPPQSEASLRELAGVTAGGAYFSLMEGIEGMGRRISYQIASYYTVGFQAESPPDQPAKLKIECTRPGTKVTTRTVVPILQ
jgi:Ca-activated chloride channel family protein